MRKTKNVNRSTRRTRAAIRSALLASMEQKPVTEITVQEIIDSANVCRTTFYAHFRDIYDLVQSVGDEIIEEVAKNLESMESETEQPNTFPTIKTVVSVYAKYADTIRMLNSMNGDPAFDKRMQDRINEVIRNIRKQEDGTDFREDLYQIYSCYVISGGISVLNHLISKQVDWDPELAYELIRKMAIYADEVFIHQPQKIVQLYHTDSIVS